MDQLVCIICGLLSKIVSYLSTLFDESLQHRTVNAYHHLINRVPISKHPNICALLTVIFNQRPPQQQYTFIWDVDIVLTYAKNNVFKFSRI